MADCEFENLLTAYHDGALDAARRAEVDRHIQGCPACAAELAQLRSLSQLIESNVSLAPGLSQIARHRLHNRLDAAMDEGILRAARIVSAIAACILAGSSIWLMRAREISATPPPWVDVAAQADTSSAMATPEASTPAAVWYLASASNESP
jgi:anti-sigma factor RsiW